MLSTVGGVEGYCNLVFCLSVYLSVYEQNSGELTTLGLQLSYYKMRNYTMIKIIIFAFSNTFQL